MTFQESGLNSDLIKAVTDLGFVTPTPIQQQTIALLANEKTDLVALAQTGTGKTAAFGLPLLNAIDTSNKTVLGFDPRSYTRALCADHKRHQKLR